MQSCPKCGRRMGTDWSAIVQILACSLLYCVFIVATRQAPASDWSVAGLLAYLLFLAATMWRGLVRRKERIEALRLDQTPVRH